MLHHNLHESVWFEWKPMNGNRLGNAYGHTCRGSVQPLPYHWKDISFILTGPDERGSREAASLCPCLLDNLGFSEFTLRWMWFNHMFPYLHLPPFKYILFCLELKNSCEDVKYWISSVDIWLRHRKYWEPCLVRNRKGKNDTTTMEKNTLDERKKSGSQGWWKAGNFE